MRQTWLLVAAGMFLTIGVAIVSILWAAGAPRRDAEKLLREARSLQAGTSTFEDAHRLASRYGKYQYSSDESRKCTPSDCGFALLFENKLLERLHLAPPTSFVWDAEIHNGRVTFMQTGFLADHACVSLDERCYPAMVTDRLRPDDFAPGSYYVGSAVDGSGRAVGMMVWLAPGATEDQRRRAYSFNLQCLDKIGGCKDSREFLPAVWKDAEVHRF